MKIGFNEATTRGCSDLEKDIRLCAKAGFEYIELRFDMIQTFLEKHSAKEIGKLLDSCGIRPHALNAVYTYGELFGKTDSRERQGKFVEEFLQNCRLSEQIGAGHMIIVPPMNPAGFMVPYEKTEEESTDDFIRIVEKLEKLSSPYGIRLCLEPVGALKSSVRSVCQMNKIIRAVDRPNVGIVLDAYNLYMTYMDSRYEDIALLDGRTIFAVHINNADPVSPGLEARRFCDSGVINLRSFLREIKNKGYTGMVSVETFRPEYWAYSPERLIPLAYETTWKVLEENGCI